MKKNIAKRLIITSIIGSTLLTGAATFAESAPLLIATKPGEVTIQKDMEKMTPPGTVILNKDDIYMIDGQEMIPLRKAIEGVGLDVKWNEEKKVAVIEYINKSLEIGLDGLYKSNGKDLDKFAKAVIKEDRLYVPAEVLKSSISVEANRYGDEFVVKREAIHKDLSGHGEVVEISEGGNAKLITFHNNFDMQKYTLVIGDETIIKDPITGNAIKADDIKVGDPIYTEYSGAMTRSIPPQTLASLIEVTKDTAVSYLVVEKNEGDRLIVNIGTRGGVVVAPMDEVIIENEDGEKLGLKDIKAGDKIRAYHSQAMILMEPMTLSTTKIVKVK